MKRPLLALAVATTVIAFGMPAVVSAATPASSFASYGDGKWGPFFSKYSGRARANAEGSVYVDTNGRVVVGGKLYDKRSPKSTCGYVEVKFGDFQPEDRNPQHYSAKACDGWKQFRFWEFGAQTVQLRVCFDDAWQGKHKCGKWNYIYETAG
ncbi:hypothetical protein [Nonomuraea africana]|uniref:Secreted protein n=1 Tax=Nonomuraea africana TaxID=46171 RepID=A0ABR9KKJ4_9ACTN|nr:hypothetical protein [Nonomuraea africana]MBE1562138.1 hypothetical protein [Nonomuraea africana]